MERDGNGRYIGNPKKMSVCKICGKSVLDYKNRSTCSVPCQRKLRGIQMTGDGNIAKPKRVRNILRLQKVSEKNPMWKGGRTLLNGYVKVKYYEYHPNKLSDDYVFEHTLVAEKKIGRHLGQDEVVHHINKIKTDNRPENLQVMTRGDHTRLHLKGRKKGSIIPI